MRALTVKTSCKREIVDLTGQLEAIIPDGGEGVLHLSVAHTTAAVTTADLDPGTDLDMLDAFEAMVPKFRRPDPLASGVGIPTGTPTVPSGNASGLPYRHPHDPSHVEDHILSSLIGTSVCIPFKEGKLVLGTWQRVVLIEFDGPQERSLYTHALWETDVFRS